MEFIVFIFIIFVFFILFSNNTKKPKDFDWPDNLDDKAELPQKNTNHYSENDNLTKNKWSLKLLKDLEWRRFEELCTAYLTEIGFICKALPFGTDGGIDINLFWEGNTNKVSIVQCKAWPNTLVGVAQVRELYGVMVSEKVNEAFFITSNDFSKEAKKFAADKNLTMVTGYELVRRINELTHEQKNKLFDFATRGYYSTPTCVKCGLKMIFRNGNPNFWGCSDYPKCRNTLKMSRNRLQ